MNYSSKTTEKKIIKTTETINPSTNEVTKETTSTESRTMERKLSVPIETFDWLTTVYEWLYPILSALVLPIMSLILSKVGEFFKF